MMPGAGVEAGRRPPGGLGLDGGEDIITLESCGSAEVVTVGVGPGFSVSLHDASSRLIYAGWLPQDRVFGLERGRWSKNERGRSP